MLPAQDTIIQGPQQCSKMSTHMLPKNFQDFLKNFILSCLDQQPSDLIDYAATYFRAVKVKRDYSIKKTSHEELASYGVHLSVWGLTEELGDEELWIQSPKERRRAVAAPSLDPTKIERQISLVFHQKSKEKMDFLRGALKELILLRKCDDEQIETIAEAMFPRTVTNGEVIIKQGDDGDNFYLIEKGTFHVHVEIGEYEVNKQLDGKGSFGELALLHDCPRTATVIADSDGIVWCLDQQTFQIILITETASRKYQFEEVLKSNKALSVLTYAERLKLVDALHMRQFEGGSCIIKEGEDGMLMYFIVSGQVRITVKNEETGIETEVGRILTGDHFGELALAMNKRRQASAHAEGKVMCAELEVAAFERLLGSYKEIIRRNIDIYNKERKKAGLHEIKSNEIMF